MAVVLAGFLLFSLGCGGSGSSSHTQLRIMQASPNETNVDVSIDGKTVASDVGYESTTGYMSVDSGSRHVQIFATGTTSNPLIDETISVTSGTSYTYLISNFSSSLDFPQFVDDNSAPATGDFKLRIIHASPSLGASADVYIVPPGTNISTVSPNFSNLPFNGASGYLSQVAGAVEVFFTFPGTKAVIIDTGTLNFSANQIRTIVALDGASGSSILTFTTLSDAN